MQLSGIMNRKKYLRKKNTFPRNIIFALVMLNLRYCLTVKWRYSRDHWIDKPRTQMRDKNWRERLTNCQLIVIDANKAIRVAEMDRLCRATFF